MAEFLKSATRASDVPHDLPIIVFAGRSNVGKSSTINRLLNRKNFARTSSVPGKTVHINMFRLDGRLYLADIPGYGFSRSGGEDKLRWSSLMEDFFATDLSLVVLIVDIRHPPTKDDIDMADFLAARGLPTVVLANKCDKIKKNEVEDRTAMIAEALRLPENMPVIAFSAEKGDGCLRLEEIVRGLA